MTDKLYSMFKSKYPGDNPRIEFYGAQERIDLSLTHPNLTTKHELLTFSEVDSIAKSSFQGFSELKCGSLFQLEGIVLTFNVEGKKELSNYQGHTFWLPRFTAPLDMEINLSNRGAYDLETQQRNNYFNFVNDLFEKIKENSSKA